MSKKKRLGRGLEALLGVGNSTPDEATASKPNSTSEKKESKFEISNDSIDVDTLNDLLKDDEQENGVTPVILPFKPQANSKVASVAPVHDLNDIAAGNAKSSHAASNNSEDGIAKTIAISSKPSLGDPGVQSITGGSDLDSNNSMAPSGSDQSSSESLINKATPIQSALAASSVSSRSSYNKTQLANLGSSDDLFNDNDLSHATGATPKIVELNVYDVDDNPFQPRREFNKAEIESLAESLKTHDQLQPILVRRVNDRYQLISGERRLRAAIHAGWSKIGAQVREADDRLVAELAIVENLQRKDLNPIEKALSFRRYLKEHACPQDELANRLKIDRSTVANLLRLLELPQAVQKSLQVGLITNGHARALLPLGEEHLQIEFCNRIQREGMSVRATEQLVRDKIDQEDGLKAKSGTKSRTKTGQILSLEKELRTALGTKTEISPSSRGRGKIVIHYSSREEFERLHEYLVDGEASDSDAA